MEQNKPRYSVKSPSRGGARAGAGRKKGSSPRYTLESLLENLEKHTGRPYAEQVAINYAKWDQAQKWANRNGLKFRIITEQDIFHQGRAK